MADFQDVVLTPDHAGIDVRRRLGIKETEELRISFIPGPGDVAGTFEHWLAKRHDPRVPTVAYSLMFYELMEQLGAASQTISLHPVSKNAQKAQNQFRFVHLPSQPSHGRWGYFLSQYRLSKEIVSAVQDYDPHIVVTSTHTPSAAWKGLSKGRKLILSAHNSFWPKGSSNESWQSRIRARILSSRAASIDAAICTSGECARQLSALTRGRILGEVECPQIVERHIIETRNSVQNILFLGRIEESKGVFLLIDAFEQLAGKHRLIRLSIAGDGSVVERLKAQIAGSQFSDRIDFRGRLDSAGVHHAIAASDLIVCPTMTTFNEGLAVVGFEAAAHGIPTLLSSVVPAADLLADSCAIFRADNVIALRDALAALIEDGAVYRQKCEATFPIRDMIYNGSLSWGSGLFRAMLKV